MSKLDSIDQAADLQRLYYENIQFQYKMGQPPHPGEFIAEVYLEPNGISARELARTLGVSPSTLSRLLNRSTTVSPSMALRLSKALGRSPESWLGMQSNYDLWNARRTVKLGKISKLWLSTA